MNRDPSRAYAQLMVTTVLLASAFLLVVISEAIPGVVFRLIGLVVMTRGLALLVPVVVTWLVGRHLLRARLLTVPHAIGGAAALALLTVVSVGDESIGSRLAAMLQITYYKRELLQLQQEAAARRESPAVAVLPLEGFGSMGSGIAYDPTDQLSLPDSLRDSRWKGAVAKTELAAPELWVRRVAGHFYQWNHP